MSLIASQISPSTRYCRFSLGEVPLSTGLGAYTALDRVTEWNQDRGKFHLVMYLHDGIFSLNGIVFPFRRGGLFLVPPGSRCRVEAIGDREFGHCYVTLFPRDKGRDVFLIPLFTQFSDSECDVWEDLFRVALNRLSQTRTSMDALIWGLAWRIAEPMTALDANPVLDSAVKWIDGHIAEKFSIRDVAAAVDISHNHLIRHFRSELGITPIEYIRQHRAELARGMLTDSTKSIKRIAHEVGVPNLQSFNRLIRECLGMPPRQVRKARMDLDYFRARQQEAREST